MLVRKFMRQKIKKEAKDIIDIKEDPPYENAHLFTTPEQRQIIKNSLYQTERYWEMEP